MPNHCSCQTTVLLCLSIFASSPRVLQSAENSPSSNTLDADTSALLDQIEKVTGRVKTISAKVTYDRIQHLLADHQQRVGTVRYESGPPAKIHIHFETLKAGRRLDKQSRHYIFDGTWLVERLDDQKLFIRRRFASADPKATKKDPLALGEGPFPLPFKMSKDRWLKRYTIARSMDIEKKGPKNTTHLRLKPRIAGRNKLTHIDLWYDKVAMLPVLASTFDESENESIIRLEALKVNIKLPKDTFDISPPTEKGWRVEEIDEAK